MCWSYAWQPLVRHMAHFTKCFSCRLFLHSYVQGIPHILTHALQMPRLAKLFTGVYFQLQHLASLEVTFCRWRLPCFSCYAGQSSALAAYVQTKGRVCPTTEHVIHEAAGNLNSKVATSPQLQIELYEITTLTFLK